jgi:hypothetical protein
VKIVERQRRDTPVESGRDERDRLRRHVRRLSERNAVAFDEGFAAAVRMVEAGADLERLRAASGVVAANHEDTSPTELRCELGRAATEPATISDFDGDTDVEIQLVEP